MSDCHYKWKWQKKFQLFSTFLMVQLLFDCFNCVCFWFGKLFTHPFSDKKLFLFRLFLDKQIGLRVLFHLVCWKNVCCPFPESKTSKKCLTTRNVIKLVWKSVLKVFILAYYQDKVPDFNSCAALPPHLQAWACEVGNKGR